MESAPSADNIRFFEEDGANAYAEAIDRGHRVDGRLQTVFVTCVVMAAVLAVGLIVPKDIVNQAMHNGGAGFTFSWFVDSFSQNVNGLVGVFNGSQAGSATVTRIVRYLVIMFAGAGLALCGAVYQGAFRNALVSPSSLGVMSGSSLGMIAWIVFFVSDEGANPAWVEELSGTAGEAAGTVADDLLSLYSLSILSFIGCALVVMIVLFTLKVTGRNGMSGIMIIIIGQAIGSVAGAVTSAVRYYYVTVDPAGVKATLLTELSIASFYRTFTWIDIAAIGVPLLVCVAIVLRNRQKMMVLAFGPEEGRSMGVDSKKVQYLVVGVCTLLTALIVCFCGRIGFVGFLIPHLSRRLVGPNFKYLLPCAMALGAAFVLVAYVLVEMLLGPEYETMTGMFISIGGAAVFLASALRGKGGAYGGFRQ